MGSVFKKLIRQEFGIGNYERYCRYIYSDMENQKSESRLLYEEMYQYLKTKDVQMLALMKERLDMVILQAFGICRHYSLAVVATAVTILLIVLFKPTGLILYPLLLLAGAGFFAKTYEYLSNKYCYVDARMVLVYKAVLESLCPKMQ